MRSGGRSAGDVATFVAGGYRGDTDAAGPRRYTLESWLLTELEGVRPVDSGRIESSPT